MMEKIWRYSVNEVEAGGIVLADSQAEAESKLRKKYEEWTGSGNSSKAEITVWKAVETEGYNENIPDVLEIY